MADETLLKDLLKLDLSEYTTAPYNITTNPDTTKKPMLLSDYLRGTTIGDEWKTPAQDTLTMKSDLPSFLGRLGWAFGTTASDAVRNIPAGVAMASILNPVETTLGFVGATKGATIASGLVGSKVAALPKYLAGPLKFTGGVLGAAAGASALYTATKGFEIKPAGESDELNPSKLISEAKELYAKNKITEEEYNKRIEEAYSFQRSREQMLKNEAVDLVKGRDYPDADVANSVLTWATDWIQDRRLLRSAQMEARGQNPNDFSYQAGSVVGSLASLMAANYLYRSALLQPRYKTLYKGSRFRETAVKEPNPFTREQLSTKLENFGKAYMGAESVGEYTAENVLDYIERTGDKDLINYNPSDVQGLTASAFAAINAMTEYELGGIENIITGSFKKVGIKTPLVYATGKIALQESSEEFIQQLEEFLARKIDNTTDKTWGQAFKEALIAGAWGAAMGGFIGGTTFQVNRANLIKGIMKFGEEKGIKIDKPTATKVADTMMETVSGSLDPKKKDLWNNLRQKISVMLETSDIANKEDRIDAITDLEYALIATDAGFDGIDIENHPLFQGEVNKLGWFRAGIPEESRAVVNDLLAELNDLETQLKTLNEAQDKDWEKIDEIERKLEQFDRYVLDKLGENAPASLRELDNELRKVENKYVNKENKKAGVSETAPVEQVKDFSLPFFDGKITTYDKNGKIKKDVLEKMYSLFSTEQLDKVIGFNGETLREMLAKSFGTVDKNLGLKASATSDMIVEMAERAGGVKPIQMYNAIMVSRGLEPVADIQTPDVEFQDEVFKIADENARLDDMYPAYDGEIIEVDGKERTVYNSNGDRIAKSKEALTNFWRWFGDSKVVDDQGRPLVVYHGSNMEFDTFDKNKGGFTTEAESALYGFYFTSSAGIAESYANIARPEKIKQLEKEYQRLEKIAQKTGKASDWDAYQKVYAQYEELELNYEPTEKIYNVYLKIENPMEYDFAGKHWEEGKYLEVLLEATNKDNDGVIFRNSIDDPVGTRISDIFVAFEPTQIKSVDNRGTFSSDTGNIYYQSDTKTDLIATHAMSKEGLYQALKVGGLAMPSLAIQKNVKNAYGEIIFVAPAKMATPSKTTKVFDRDAWTPRIDFIDYQAKEGFYDKVKNILTSNGVNDISTSTFISNIQESAGGNPLSNTMAVELFGIQKGLGNDSDAVYKIRHTENLRDEYIKWYKDFILDNLNSRIFRGYTQLGNRRYAPLTLDNIVRELKTQGERRDMTADIYFFHDVIRELVTKFKDIKSIKKASNRLMSDDEVYEKTRELNQKFNDLADELKTDDGQHIPGVSLAIALIEGKGTIAENLESVRLKNDLESVKKVENLIREIKSIPVSYFESKVKRGVRFNEFSAVFVPVGEDYNDVATQLKDQGAMVIRYNSSEDLDKKIEKLTQIDNTIRFQKSIKGARRFGAYIPEYRFIQRTNKMDSSTLSHELAHDWFEINFDKFRSGKASKEFMRAWGALEKALGITDKSTKAEKAKASEAFARAYEGWIMSNKGWEKLINVDDKDKDDVIKLMLDYQSDLRDIYQDLTNPYFKQTWGKLGEMKPEIKAWFDKVVNITDIDKLVERGEMTPEQASQEKLNQAIDTVIENTEDAETKKTLKTIRVLNDTKRYEAEGGNKNSLQVRLANLAKAIDENNMLIKENYDTHRDMLEVAKQADNFVKTRLEDALAIINGQMAEQEGLFKEDIYTALERLALENGDLNLLDELKNSEVANRLAKELGQRVAGFRNWNAGDVDVVSSLKALDNKFNKALQNKKAQAQMAEAEQMFAKAQEQQDKLADKELDSFLKDVECK